MLNCSPQVLDKLLSRLKDRDYTGYAEQYPPFGAWGPFAPSAAELSAVWRKSLLQAREAGIYVNIPFCKTRCDFCFLPVTATGGDAAVIRKKFSSYLGLLEKEADMFRAAFSGAAVTTLYIGGGTPSLMTPAEIAGLFELLRSRFPLRRSAQITTEIHPETAGRRTLDAFRSAGVNWLCIGAQSLSRAVLSRAGRGQNLRSVVRAYENARRAGIKGVNIDLICGLPGQTGKSFLADVKTLAALRPDEIHLNTFIVTPYTIYGRRGGLPPDPEATERLKEEGFAILGGAGYKRLHYDSAGLGKDSKNFQTSDLKSKKSVLGLGPGAVSHAWGGARYINHVSLARYGGEIARGAPPVNRGCRTAARDEMRYYILESLSHEPRTLDARAFKNIFGAEPRAAFPREFAALKAAGVRLCGGGLRAEKSHWNILRGIFYTPAMLLKPGHKP